MRRGWLSARILLVMAAALCVLPALYLTLMAPGEVAEGPAAPANSGYGGDSSSAADIRAAAVIAKIAPLRDERLRAAKDAALDEEQNKPAAEDVAPVAEDECPLRNAAESMKEPAMPLMGREAAVGCHDAYQEMKSSCQNTSSCSDCDAAFAQYSHACAHPGPTDTIQTNVGGPGGAASQNSVPDAYAKQSAPQSMAPGIQQAPPAPNQP